MIREAVRPGTTATVLYGLIRAAMSEPAADPRAGLGLDGIEWNEVSDLAAQHGVRPLLHQALTALPDVDVAAAFREQLRDSCAAIARRNLYLSTELMRVLAALETAGIEALAFKGPALAVLAYGNLARREFVDLDILVHRQDMGGARQCLSSVGFVSRYALNRAQERIIIRRNRTYDLLSTNRQVALDLHWAFIPRYFQLAQEPDDLWQRLVQVRLAGALVNSLPPDDQLIVVCLHGSRSGWVQLKWVCDVASASRLIGDADWDRVLRRSRRWGAERCLLLGLALVRDLLGIVLPAPIVGALERDEAVEHLRGRVSTWMIAAPGRPRSRTEETSLYAALASTRRTRLRIWGGLVLAPTHEDAEHLSLGQGVAFLYAFLRPFRLLIKYLRRLPDAPRSVSAAPPGG